MVPHLYKNVSSVERVYLRIRKPNCEVRRLPIPEIETTNRPLFTNRLFRSQYNRNARTLVGPIEVYLAEAAAAKGGEPKFLLVSFSAHLKGKCHLQSVATDMKNMSNRKLGSLGGTGISRKGLLDHSDCCLPDILGTHSPSISSQPSHSSARPPIVNPRKWSTEPRKSLGTRLQEISFCSCLTFLPGPAWLLLNKICNPFSRSLYS